MLTSKQQRQAARKFVQYWQDKKGYEKGETQKFWNMLLRDIFGVDKPENLIEYEKTVQQVKSHNFIDAYIAQSQVLIEQKSVHIDYVCGFLAANDNACVVLRFAGPARAFDVRNVCG